MSARAGYSLLEVLVAFTIMAMVLAALIPGQANLLRRTTENEARLLATDYAASRIDRLGVSEPFDPGRREHSYRNWRAVEDVTLENLPSGGPRIYRVVEEIQSKSGVTLSRLEGVRPSR
jgi:general secretion pathway protein I